MNHKLFWFALDSLLRRQGKNLAVAAVFTLVIALFAAVTLIAASLQKELDLTLESLPDLTVQKITAGRQAPVMADMAYEIGDIAGVSHASERVWGYYYFQNAGVNFTVIGVDFFLPSYKESIQNAVESFDIEAYAGKDFMITGDGVKKILQANYYRDYFNFIQSNGEIRQVHLASTFKAAGSLESNDVILLPVALAREVLELEEPYATDIVVSVANPNEVETVARKIREIYPGTRVVSKNDLKSSYQNIFDYKSGIFLTLFLAVYFAFFILVYEKASGLNESEKREIGILKAVGWRIEDVLRLKLIESSLVAFFSFALGIMLAAAYVFLLDAPLLIHIFSGYSILKPALELPLHVEVHQIGLIFIATVPLYIAAVLIPAWRASVIDADEVMR